MHKSVFKQGKFVLPFYLIQKNISLQPQRYLLAICSESSLKEEYEKTCPFIPYIIAFQL